jgi:hypothetical protein
LNYLEIHPLHRRRIDQNENEWPTTLPNMSFREITQHYVHSPQNRIPLKILHFGFMPIGEHEVKKFPWGGRANSPSHLWLNRIGSLFRPEVCESRSFPCVSSSGLVPGIADVGSLGYPIPTPCRFLRFVPSVGPGENRLVATAKPAQSSAQSGS